jgi:aspartate ammonia-lyase
MAAAHGDFELNAFLPLIADALIESLSLMENAVLIFREKCVDLITADEDRCRELLKESCAFATSYTPLLGYEAVSNILKECGGDPVKTKAALEKATKEK